LWAILIFCFYGTHLNAQQNEEFEVPFKLFQVEHDTLSVNEIIEQRETLFKPKEQFRKTHPDDTYWIQLDFSNLLQQLEQKESWYVWFKNFNEVTSYMLQDDQISKQTLGSFQLSTHFTAKVPFKQEQLIDGRYLYFKVKKLNVRYPISKHTIIVYSETVNYYKENYISPFVFKSKSLTFLFLGVSLIILIITTYIYFINRKTDYLLYVIYVLCMTIYFGRFIFDFYEKSIGNFSFNSFFLSNFLEVLSNIFYILFVKYYLTTTINYPKLDKAIKGITAFLIVFLVIDSAIMLAGDFGLHAVLLEMRAIIISSFVILSILYLSYYFKNTLTYFIIFGSLFYATGSILVFITGHANYLKIGAMLEIIIFGLGLGYKIKLEYQEKIRIQQESINNYIKALRAQMNPHFIFNSLSSIQHLVLKNDTPAALMYLSKFSQLMRSTLENSIEKSVTLAEEIKLLKTYIDLESLRFDGSFSYEIKVEKHLNTHLLEVPLLIIQPFVENAILHGLLNKKEGEKKLTITFSEDINHIIATVEDNGIGRKASKTLQKKSSKPHKISRGMELTQKRIEVLEKQTDKSGSYVIEDLTDDSGNPSGTKVIVKIPKN